MKPFVWHRYSRKMEKVLANIKHAGALSQAEADARDLRLVIGEAGELELGNFVRLYALVDKEEGLLLHCHYEAFGDSALIAALEATCIFIEGKNYAQAARITGDVIDLQLQDKPGKEAFPSELAGHVNLVISAVDVLVSKCSDIPISTIPLPMPGIESSGGIEGFEELSVSQKLEVIEAVLDADIRPYIELDAGGIEVKDLKGYKVIITYAGACTSCPSAIGGTLSYISKVMREKIHPDLEVEPDMEALAGLYAESNTNISQQKF